MLHKNYTPLHSYFEGLKNMVKKKVNIKRVYGVTQGYHVGSGIDGVQSMADIPKLNDNTLESEIDIDFIKERNTLFNTLLNSYYDLENLKTEIETEETETEYVKAKDLIQISIKPISIKHMEG